MSEHEPLGPPPSTEAGDIARGLARAALSSVPVAGGPAAELLDLVVTPALHMRYDRWLRRMAESVDEMRAHGLDVRTLKDNEALITAILNATAAAARTHEEDKLEALRNAITNAALGMEADDHVQMMFIRFVDELQGLHLRMLALFRDPAAFLDQHGIGRPTRSGSRTLLIDAAIPEVAGHQEIYTLAANDLTSRGLMNGAITGMVSDAGMWQAITTPLGNRFLDFISRPKSA